jgi:putative DNA primase/helicase
LSNARTNVGVAKREKDSSSANWYLCTDKWLYASYSEYCHDTGTKAVGLRRFVNLLSDLVNNQLNLDVSRGRDRYGSYFEGLKIRSEIDTEPLLITDNLSLENKISEAKIEKSPGSTNVINKLWTSVINKVAEAIDRILNDNDGVVSHEQPEAEALKNTLIFQIEVEEELESRGFEIVVGSRVTIYDCPGHWGWASPFKVEAIEGEMVALEMVDGLIEMSRLQKYI